MYPHFIKKMIKSQGNQSIYFAAVQMWDLSTALDFYTKGKDKATQQGATSGAAAQLGGPTTEDLVDMLNHCELSNSHAPTPCCLSPSSSAYLNQAQPAQQTTRVVINPSD